MEKLTTSERVAPRITVTVPCQNVDSDGDPVNQHGETFGRGWQKTITMEKKRMVSSKFCPRDIRAGCRTAKVSGQKMTMQKCKCHDRYRLVVSGYDAINK
jgi:hypothetical protein